MGFVHDHELDRAPLQKVPKGPFQRFRRQIHQIHFPAPQFSQSFPPFLKRNGGVDDRGTEPFREKGVHLVFHQRNEGGNDQRGTV
jgi:hypothetical protein